MGPDVLLKVDSSSPVTASDMVLIAHCQLELQPKVAVLVDQRVVEADAVLIIDIGRGELANPLVDATIGKIAEHLGGDAPGGVGVLAGALALARRVGPDNALDEIAGPVGDPQPDEEVPDLVRRHLARP